METQMTNFASLRGDKESEAQNYEIVCKKDMEIGLEICRSYYTGGYNGEDKKSETIMMETQMTNFASSRDSGGGGDSRGDMLGGSLGGDTYRYRGEQL